MNSWQSLTIPTDVQVFILFMAIAGVVVSGAALTAVRLARRCAEPMRYSILFTGIIALLAIPALVGVGWSLRGSVWPTPEVEEEILKVPAELLPALLEAQVAEPAVELEPAEASPSVGGVLMVLAWAVGIAFGLCRLAFGLWKQRRAIIGLPWRPNFWTDDAKERLAQKLGLARFPEVMLSPAVPMPMVIGYWRPTIVLPESAPDHWDQAQWEAVLLHEAAHIARRDHWASLAQHFAILMFWWCPLVHLLGRRLNELRESICDDCALQGSCDPVAYAEVLVESAERFLDLQTNPVPLALLDSARGGLEARVMRLLEKEKQPMTRLTLAGKLLGVGCLVVACLATSAATALSQSAPAPQKRVQIKIVVDGKEIDLTEHIEAAQKKAPAHVHGRIVVGDDKKPIELAFTPDGKLLSGLAGGKVIVVDGATGRILAQHTDEKPVQAKPVKPDPRIEELVKQAEKIKPGSGAEIRRALQGVGHTATWSNIYKPVQPPMIQPPAVPKPGTHVYEYRVVGDQGGKKIIILSIEDGKVQQLNEKDLKKFLDKDVRFRTERIEVELKKTDTKPLPELPKPILAPKTPTVPQPAVPRTPSADLDSLQRQLERLTVELAEIRRQMDASKKK